MLERKSYTLQEITRITGVSRGTLYNEMHRGRLTAHKLASRTVVLAENFERWLASNKIEAPPRSPS